LTARKKSLNERTLAGIVFAGLSVSLLLLPLSAAQLASSGDCLPPAGTAAQSALVAGTPDHCPHTDAGVCVTALGCGGVTPALRPAAPGIGLAAALRPSATSPVARLADLYRVGPPTPPPNS